MQAYSFTSVLWRHSGSAPWYFVTLPHDISDDIDEITADVRTGFGSVRVRVTVGATTWHTSLFPDAATQSYAVPVKRAVRDAEHLEQGRPVRLEIELAPARGRQSATSK
jgi:hypothetical protein